MNLLDLCISSQLRILNGRYVGDSLGYFACLTVNALSSVDYAIASESLLSSVLYFSTQEINYLSDHVQIKLLLKCKLQKNATSESIFSSWSDTVNYRWTEGTKEEIVDALCNETILNEIINFEAKTFSEDQNGINLATEEVKSVLSIKIADKSCKKVRKRKEKIKLFRQKWSDISIYEKKKSLNFLNGLIRKNPNNNELRQKYFLQLKSFKKAIKQKKPGF